MITSFVCGILVRILVQIVHVSDWYNTCVTVDCLQMSPLSQLQLSEGSSGWSAVYPHLQTQEDLEGGAFKEEKVSILLSYHVLPRV